MQGSEALFSSCSSSCLEHLWMLICKVIPGHLFQNLLRNGCSNEECGKSSSGLSRLGTGEFWQMEEGTGEGDRSWWFGHRTARVSSMHSCCGAGALLRGPAWRTGPVKYNPFGIYPARSISSLLLPSPSCLSGTSSPSALQVQQALNGPVKARFGVQVLSNSSFPKRLGKTFWEKRGDLAPGRAEQCVGRITPHRAEGLGETPAAEQEIPLEFWDSPGV